MAVFRRQQNSAKVRTTGARVLPDTPFGAQRQLLAFVDDRRDLAPAVQPLRAAVELPRRRAQPA
jgi:hypothetical protein